MNHDTMLKDLEELFIEYNDTTDFGDYRIEVKQDFDPINPRKDWDNFGHMICFHPRYDLGDEHSYKDVEAWVHDVSGLYEDELTDYLDEDEISRCWDAAHANHIIMPLYLYDHSGITMNTTGFSCPWDSGCVGIIYVSLDEVRKEHGWKRITKARRKQIEKYLTGEVSTYDDYLTGNIYGFMVTREDEDGEEVDIDSCWGFYGYYTDDNGYMVSVIKDAIKYDIEHTPQQTEMNL
jgi:hypothetical protein